MAVRSTVIPRAPGPLATHWRYRPDGLPAFDPVVFDERALAARGALAGGAAAGRGNTHFIVLEGHALVLRHYRRGGLVRHLSERRYVWTGLARTRAVREFELLRELESEGLPVPSPFACAVTRHGFLWSGSLVTRRLAGRTLAEILDDGGKAPLPAPAVPWAAIGRCIARFHTAGIRHADLNAHNVLLDGDEVFLIDFDRAARRHLSTSVVAPAVAPTAAPGAAPGAAPETAAETVRAEASTATVPPPRWQSGNIARLRRSLVKLAGRGGRAFDIEGFAALEEAWRAALSSGQGSVGHGAPSPSAAR